MADRHPTSLVINAEIGCTSYYARRYDASIFESQKTIEMDPNYGPAYYNLGRAFGQKRMTDEAVAALAKADTLLGGLPYVTAETAYIYAASRKKEKAHQMLRALNAAAKTRYVDQYLIAVVQVGLGEKANALASLEKAYGDRSAWMPWLKVEPKFDILRSEPRFQALMSQLGFPSDNLRQ